MIPNKFQIQRGKANIFFRFCLQLWLFKAFKSKFNASLIRLATKESPTTWPVESDSFNGVFTDKLHIGGLSDGNFIENQLATTFIYNFLNYIVIQFGFTVASPAMGH
jgi:hypothetical protein